MDYDNAIKWITSKDNFYIDLGLERIKLALEKLDNPHKQLKYIHVAGTNGKGSVCAMLESILREAGYKTGLYTSPHIWEYTERIKICGQEISKNEFAEFTQKIQGLNIHLTEFEILTVIMFLYFAENNVDIVILETGLGGRLDATNVIEENLCSVITQIDLDHTERLGNTKDLIAKEKAGIIKPNCPIITGMGYEAIKDEADRNNSLLLFVTPFVNPEYIQALSLKGEHQIENLALVINVIELLFKNISSEIIKKGLNKVKHPCRFQYIEQENLIIDASHNPNGILALRNNLDLYFPNTPKRFVFGALRNKDYKKMMEILFNKDDEILLNIFNYPNATSIEELKEVCPFEAGIFDRDLLKKDKLNIICGSFYMIGEMRWLKNLMDN